MDKKLLILGALVAGALWLRSRNPSTQTAGSDYSASNPAPGFGPGAYDESLLGTPAAPTGGIPNLNAGDFNQPINSPINSPLFGPGTPFYNMMVYGNAGGI